MSGEIMKKTAETRQRKGDDLRAEYRFDYSSAKPNRFASKMTPVGAGVLDSDAAAVFDSSAKVNARLQSAIGRKRRKQPRVRGRR